ncbi:SDR family oxidoreductase [Fluviispira vulneris]|uniref:SDR family oxidoreductase n=1 Tax=Fluviispira vulneris TaxID=2763012 RepID=UPI00164913D2|nr:SDR family oxidoreductase [Fluviispira vulneris]
MTQKILITGGLGYLGSRLFKKLSESNQYEVYSTSRNKNIDINIPYLRIIDFTSEKSIMDCCEGIDTILHLSTPNEIDSANNVEKAIIETCIYTYNLLSAAEKSNVKKIIYFSTAHIYGSPLIGDINEESLPKPRHPYSICHRMAEDLILSYHSNKKITGLVLRLSNGFGYPVSKNINRWSLLVNNLCREVIENKCMTLKNPMQKRDFIPIGDIENCILHLLSDQKINIYDGIFNLGGKNTLTVYDMAKLISKRCQDVLKFTPKIIMQDIGDEGHGNPTFTYCINKIESTGFKLSGAIEEEIDKTLIYCQSHF